MKNIDIAVNDVKTDVEQLAEVKTATPHEDATEAEKEEFTIAIKEEKEHIEGILKDHRELLKEAEKKYDDEVAAVKVKNEFAANLEDHLDVSESHMTRIEQAIMEEL